MSPQVLETGILGQFPWGLLGGLPGYCIWSGMLLLLAGSVWLVRGRPPEAVREPAVLVPMGGSCEGAGAPDVRQMSLMYDCCAPQEYEKLLPCTFRPSKSEDPFYFTDQMHIIKACSQQFACQ